MANGNTQPVDITLITKDRIEAMAGKVRAHLSAGASAAEGEGKTLAMAQDAGFATAGSTLLDWYAELHKARRKNPEFKSEEFKLLRQVAQQLVNHMQLREITQDTDPKVLTALVQPDAERVHPFRGANDAEKVQELVQNRLAPADSATLNPDGSSRDYKAIQTRWSKHAYGLFLPWEKEPSCIVYTAHQPKPKLDSWRQMLRLTRVDQLFNDIAGLLNIEGAAQTEPSQQIIYYSISNITYQLPGFPIGRTLIDKVSAHQLSHYPNAELDNATLSPMRSFPAWLKGQLENTPEEKLFTAQEIKDVKEATGGIGPVEWLQKLMPFETVKEDGKDVIRVAGHAPTREDFRAAAGAQEGAVLPRAIRAGVDAAGQEVLFGKLRTDLCLQYLASAEHQNGKGDAVTHFHLSNGAYIGRIALQENGAEWAKAGGLMVNYVYNEYERSPSVLERRGAYDAALKAKPPENPPLFIDEKLYQRIEERQQELGQATPPRLQPIEAPELQQARAAAIARQQG